MIPTSLAVDWVSNNLYWTEIENPTHTGGRLMVSKADGRYKRSLIVQNLELPTAVAVDPQLGRVYWADGGSHPKIEVAWMDGSRRKALVSTRLGKPSALVVDHAMNNTIYWADIKLNTIESIQKDGNNRKIIVSGLQLKNPVNKEYKQSCFFMLNDRKNPLYYD